MAKRKGRTATTGRSGSARARGAKAGTGSAKRRRSGEADVPTPPSTLTYEPRASAASTGRSMLAQRRRQHTEASPAITGGDVDADWEGASTVGDETATGDNPTPDQDNVEEVGRAVGVDYQDTEELKSTPKIDRRDKKRWELDPASSEDYRERNRRK